MMSQEEEELYKKFVERYERENQRTDVLAEERKAHNKRYNEERFRDGNEHHVGSYFNGWAQISTLIARCFGVKNIARVRGTRDEERAKEMARKLSDIFFEYAYFNNKDYVENRTDPLYLA
jgi:hypothetical protein